WSSDNFNVTINSIGVAQGFAPGTDRVRGRYQTIFGRGGFPDPCTPQYGFAEAAQDITILPKVTITGAELCADAIPLTLEPSNASGSFTLTLVSSAGSVNIVNESRNGGTYRDSFKLGTL